MGSETIDFAKPHDVMARELALLETQNRELENSNRLRSRELANGLSGIIGSAQGTFNIASFNPLFQANIAAPITIDFTFLNYFYKTHGIIQTAIKEPVQDALRGGVEIQSKDMDEYDIEDFTNYLEEEDIFGAVITAMSWARLFGGGALVVNDGAKDWSTPLKEDTPIRYLKLYPAARWELSSPSKLVDPKEIVDSLNPWENAAACISDYYGYYGMKLHKSRVITFQGEEAPWMIRWMLQGWGMSEVERMVEDFNLYLRTRNVLYDILNEAKVDVFRIEGFSEVLMTPEGEQKMLRRIATVQQAKNLNNALLMDKNDEYDQKQLTFSGIGDVMEQNKDGIASALRMPKSKIFGDSAKGLGDGEDATENYNAMVESSVRQRIRKPLRRVIDLMMRYKYGDVYRYKMGFKPLRVMSEKDMEDIREKKFNRVIAMYDRGMMDSKEVGDACRKDNLISVDTKAAAGKLDEFPEGPMTGMFDEDGGDEKGSKKPKESKEK